MIPYIFYFIICLILIIIQSTAIPFLPESIKCYDLLILFVLYVGLFKEVLSTFVVVFILGLIMDLLSGGGFGLYISAYFWIFISARMLIRFLDAGSLIVLPVAVVGGVILENLIFLLPVFLTNSSLYFMKIALYTVAIQILIAVFTGPLLIMFLYTLNIKWEKLFAKIAQKRSDIG